MGANKEKENPVWYVLYTKARHEKKVAQRLLEAGYKVYCPLHKVQRQWSDRKMVVEEPLFISLVFIQIENHRRDEVFVFPGVVRYLFWLGRPAQVRQAEIDIIQKWLGEYKHEDIDISDIQSGAHVRITSGRLSGEEATFLFKTNHHIIVQLKELGVQLSLSRCNNEIEAI